MNVFPLYRALASFYVIFIGGFKVDYCDNNTCIQFVSNINFMMSMQKMDRLWMYDMLDPSKRLKQRFMNGVFEFVSTTMDQPSYIEDGGIRCPCVRCICQKILKPSHVRAHLLQYGFQSNYHVWIYHGEDRPTDDSIVYTSTSYENMNYGANFGSVTKMVYDAYMQVADITTHYENVQSEEMNREEPPNVEAQNFYDMLAFANKLFTMEQESRLLVAIRLFASRTN